MLGVLSLKKTYGRLKDKLLYKFTPYGEEECCLVPYSIKSSFSKLNEDFQSLFLNSQILISLNMFRSY